MATIDGISPTIPGEEPERSPQRVPRITLVIHNMPHSQVRSAGSPAEAPRHSTRRPTDPPKPPQRRGGQHRIGDSTWLDLLERVLHSWPLTLRVILLAAVVLTGTTAVAATLGIGGQLLLAALSLRSRRAQRVRVEEIRQQAMQETSTTK